MFQQMFKTLFRIVQYHQVAFSLYCMASPKSLTPKKVTEQLDTFPHLCGQSVTLRARNPEGGERLIVWKEAVDNLLEVPGKATSVRTDILVE